MRKLSAQIQTKLYLGHVKFFRGRLLILSADAISKLIDSMDKEVKQIRSDVLKMCWYMRGGITYNEALHFSPVERDLIADIIKDNLETTKKSGLPFY